MDFIEVTVHTAPDFADMLIAEMGDCGYEAFIDTEDGFSAYITEDLFSEQQLAAVLDKYRVYTPLSHEVQKIEKQNWNEEWEKNFEPLIIGNVCSVRASFHPAPQNVTYDIVINPKMSFGTGHHETTTLMLENQLALNHKHKMVLDMGCGTGILAIMACKLDAAKVVAVDVEDWTVENARENAAENDCPDIEVRHGDATAIETDEPYDIILANINRNVLLQDMPVYARHLVKSGALVLSGFYTQDLPLIKEKAEQNDIRLDTVRTKNNWVSAIFYKN
jgi:ribosomal protein L11 methyltransferase